MSDQNRTSTLPGGSLLQILIIFMIGSAFTETVSAQIELSGYVQTEWQHFDLRHDPNDRGVFSDERKNLFLTRRGRAKLSHTSEEGFVGVLQIDATERGMSVKDAYLNAPLLDSGRLDVTVGLFNKPNYEVILSSRRREATERSQVVRSFYPNERGLGFMFASSPVSFGEVRPTVQLALYNGNGTLPEVDAYKDITGRVHVPVTGGEDSKVSLGLGGLFYIGGLRQPDDTVIVFSEGERKLELRERNDTWPGYGTRSHFGIEIQLGLDIFSFGRTNIRGEYLRGTVPSQAIRERMDILENSDPHDSAEVADTVLVSVESLLLRNRAGYYVLFAQELGSTFSIAARYDVFDRNTELTGDQVDEPEDRETTIVGFGLLADFGPIRLTGWYEIPFFAENEARFTDQSGTIHSGDLKDNKTTIRFQYRMK